MIGDILYNTKKSGSPEAIKPKKQQPRTSLHLTTLINYLPTLLIYLILIKVKMATGVQLRNGGDFVMKIAQKILLENTSICPQI